MHLEAVARQAFQRLHQQHAGGVGAEVGRDEAQHGAALGQAGSGLRPAAADGVRVGAVGVRLDAPAFHFSGLLVQDGVVGHRQQAERAEGRCLDTGLLLRHRLHQAGVVLAALRPVAGPGRVVRRVDGGTHVRGLQDGDRAEALGRLAVALQVGQRVAQLQVGLDVGRLGGQHVQEGHRRFLPLLQRHVRGTLHQPVARRARRVGVQRQQHLQRLGVAVVRAQQLGGHVAGHLVARVQVEGAAGAGHRIAGAVQLALGRGQVQPVQRHAGRQLRGLQEVLRRLRQPALAHGGHAVAPLLVCRRAAAFGRALRHGGGTDTQAAARRRRLQGRGGGHGNSEGAGQASPAHVARLSENFRHPPPRRSGQQRCKARAIRRIAGGQFPGLRAATPFRPIQVPDKRHRYSAYRSLQTQIPWSGWPADVPNRTRTARCRAPRLTSAGGSFGTASMRRCIEHQATGSKGTQQDVTALSGYAGALAGNWFFN